MISELERDPLHRVSSCFEVSSRLGQHIGPLSSAEPVWPRLSRPCQGAVRRAHTVSQRCVLFSQFAVIRCVLDQFAKIIPIILMLLTCQRKTSSRGAIRGKALFVLLFWKTMNSSKQNYFTISDNLGKAVSKVAQKQKRFRWPRLSFSAEVANFLFYTPRHSTRLRRVRGDRATERVAQD